MSENNASKSSQSNESIDNGSEVYPGFQTMKEFTQNGLRLLMENIRDSNGLPNGQRWDYYTTFPSFKKVMDTEGKRILQLLNMILQHQSVQGNILRRDLEEKFELLVDANDQIFERVGNTLDEILGIRKNPEPVLIEASGKTRAVSGSWNKNIGNKADAGVPKQFQPQSVRLLTAKNIERPQAKFRDKTDNSNNAWEPLIKDKPNAIKPLAILLEDGEDGECFSHPYEFELDRFKVPQHQLQEADPIPSKSLDEVPLVLVEKTEQIASLLDDLLKYNTLAVDLEHHSYRTFQGFTCLMQISTGDKDYLVDTLCLRSELHVLNEVFTNPKILKVFHGAEQDIQWLQRDLSLYIVNMFDTYQAAKVLNFAGLSLAFLLKHFCDVYADKHFQLADWRIRPLPEELQRYARADTHYLIYIYECMRNALIKAANGQTNLLQAVYQRSTDVCKRRYKKFILQEDSHMVLYRKSRKMFHNQQMYALQHLFQWRDKVAREEDESIAYVLPNHMLLHICELLPREIQGILSCCNPIPPLVRQHLVEIHQIILKAREQPLVKPVVEEELRQRPVAETWAKLNLDNPLHCPHDLTFQLDFRDDLPTLLVPLENSVIEKISSKSLSIRASVPLYSNNSVTYTSQNSLEIDRAKIDFGQSPSHDEDSGSEVKPKLKELISKVKFLSPFECYKKVRPYLDHLHQEKLRKHQEVEKARETAAQAQDSNDLTFEQRISRMQEDIRKMSEENQNTRLSSSGSRIEEDLSLSAQAKGVKRKSSLLKGKSFDEEEERQPKQKQSKIDGKSPKGVRKDHVSKGDSKHLDKTPKTQNAGGSLKFEQFDYQQANYSKFQSGDPRHKSQEVKSHFATKKQKNKNFKSSTARATRGLEGGQGGKASRGRR